MDDAKAITTISNSLEHVIKQSNQYDLPWKSSPDEPYALRRFNPNRSEDTQRYTDMDRHPNTVTWTVPNEPADPEEIDRLISITEADPEEPTILWAITDDSGEAVGWIQFYLDSYLTNRVRKIYNIPQDAFVLETSFTKLFNSWPKRTRFIKNRDNLVQTENRGVVVSGLKQALIKIKQMENTLSKAMNKKPEPIYITAYTDTYNEPSKKVLEKCGFVNFRNFRDEGELLNGWIIKL